MSRLGFLFLVIVLGLFVRFPAWVMVLFGAAYELYYESTHKKNNSSSSDRRISSASKPKSVSVIENGQEKKVCPDCNAKVSSDANWCPQCGHQFKK